ncbi:DNA/RNA nuclease SfsA, partial [Escherichia coli]|uniref:DNA/RNA nuclease SfsA n=1 Tax=Escherichia coli TaxID=562 RepID=UPI0022835219
AVTLRGQKHLRELLSVVESGQRAVLFFAVLHSGIEQVAPAHHIDERYAALKVLGHTRKIKKLSLDIDYSRHRMHYSREPLAIGDRFMWSGEIA